MRSSKNSFLQGAVGTHGSFFAISRSDLTPVKRHWSGLHDCVCHACVVSSMHRHSVMWSSLCEGFFFVLVMARSIPYVADVVALARGRCPIRAFATLAVPVATATLAALAMYTAQAPLVEYIAPAPAVSYAAPTPFVKYISPAPAMSYVAPRPSPITSRPLSQCTGRSRLSWTTSRQHQQGVCTTPAVCAALAPGVGFITPAPAVYADASPAPVIEYIAPAPTVFAARASWSTSRQLQQCTLHLRLSWTTSRQRQQCMSPQLLL